MKKTNQIKTLTDENRETVTWDNGMQDVMIRHFTKLSKASDTDWSDVVQCGVTTVTDE